MIGEVTAVLSRSALLHNYRVLSARAAPARLICMLKADGYGHGAVECCRTLRAAGADFFAVARLSEALLLREIAPRSSILVLGRTDPEKARLLAEKNLLQSIHSGEYARALAAAAGEHPIAVHIKLDCGMGRLGFPIASANARAEAAHVCTLRGLSVKAAFSHLPSADLPAEAHRTLRSIRMSRRLARELGLPVHILNSAALLSFPVASDAFVRPGIALYGYPPVPAPEAALRPVMRLLAPVLQVRRIRRGEAVGYGGTFLAERDLLAAVVGIGYGDGLPRSAQGGFLNIEGHLAKLIGRISMDLSVCALPDGAEVSEGALALVFGGDQAALPALADAAGTIPYELLSGLTPRVRRIWQEEFSYK